MEQFALPIAFILLVLGIALKRFSMTFGSLLKPPLTIQLVPVVDRAKGRFADSHRRELESLGFSPIGLYEVREMKGVMLSAFANSTQAMCAVVYRHPMAGVFADVCILKEDDTSLTVTSAPAGGNLDQPPGHRKVFMPKASLRQLCDCAMRERAGGPYQRLDSSNFVRIFERAYAREMQWRKDRGGPTEAEVRREAHAMGIHSEKTIQKATASLRKQYSEPEQPVR